MSIETIEVGLHSAVLKITTIHILLIFVDTISWTEIVSRVWGVLTVM
jgi:hypothetical protein